MKICVSRNGIAACAIVALAGTAAAGDSELVVNTMTPSVNGATERAFLSGTTDLSTNLVQEFEIDAATNLETLSFFGSATDVHVYLTKDVGLVGDANADDPVPTGSIVWESGSYTSPGGALGTRGWQDFDVTGISLDSGTYYVVLASDDIFGAYWSYALKNDPVTENVGDKGSAQYAKGVGDQRVASIDYNFDEGSPFVFGLRITGSTVPTPGTLAIAAAGGLLCIRRRR